MKRKKNGKEKPYSYNACFHLGMIGCVLVFPVMLREAANHLQPLDIVFSGLLAAHFIV